MTNKITLAKLDARARYWLVRADGGKYYNHFKYEHFISVHHNEITLDLLQSTEILLTKEKTVEHYKNVITKQHENDTWSKHQITFAAKRLYNFIEDMSIGDYVVIPSFKSHYFLIGQIVDDVIELPTIQNITLNHGYDITNDRKRRKVQWINEVPRYKINSKFLYSTLTMHHSIIEITQYSKYLDPLISPFYYKNGTLNLQLNINTQKPITSDVWKELYSIIDNSKNFEIKEEIIATTNVESPGNINLQAIGQFISDYNWVFTSGLWSLAFLFGDIDLKGIKIKGVFPYLHARKMKELDERLKTVEVETAEKDAQLNDLKRNIEIEKARKELQAIRNLDITIDVPSVHYGNEEQKQKDFVEKQDEE